MWGYPSKPVVKVICKDGKLMPVVDVLDLYTPSTKSTTPSVKDEILLESS